MFVPQSRFPLAVMSSSCRNVVEGDTLSRCNVHDGYGFWSRTFKLLWTICVHKELDVSRHFIIATKLVIVFQQFARWAMWVVKL